MLQELLQAFILIFVAEMGDKTQILAMAFATKYPVKKVLTGILIGSFLNHGLAVALGSQLTKFIPMDTIQIIAGLAFLVFAFWSLRIEDDDNEEKAKEVKYGAVATVGIAFFIGELGDKTQLTAITLASGADSPLIVLIGTVAGMVATGSLGIYIGKMLGDRVPEILIKAIASVVFLIFATQKLYSVSPVDYINPFYIIVYMVVIIIPFALMMRRQYKSFRLGIKTQYEHKSKELYDYYQKMNKELEDICLGEGVCKKCEGRNCPVGQTKSIIKELQKPNVSELIKFESIDDSYKGKSFDNNIAQRIIEVSREVVVSDIDEAYLEKVIQNMELISVCSGIGKSKNNY